MRSAKHLPDGISVTLTLGIDGKIVTVCFDRARDSKCLFDLVLARGSTVEGKRRGIRVVVLDLAVDHLVTIKARPVINLVPVILVSHVVNSHSHFDHSGGLRAAVAEGTTIVAQAQSKAYFEKAFATRSRIAPDLLAKSGKQAKVIGVGEKLVMKDATRTVELHRIKETDHVDIFLMVYLPKERLLVQAEAFTPGPPNGPVPNPPNAYHVNLVQNHDRLKLDVDRILPLHGRMVPLAELKRMVGK